MVAVASITLRRVALLRLHCLSERRLMPCRPRFSSNGIYKLRVVCACVLLVPYVENMRDMTLVIYVHDL